MSGQKFHQGLLIWLLSVWTFCVCAPTCAQTGNTEASDAQNPVRVFIFAGQSNMVGSDSHVDEIQEFPPFDGLQQTQQNVAFSYCIGRENKTISEGWEALQPVNQIVGPELSFARTVTRNIDDRIAIIKVAAGGTHLGGDWNPDQPSGFKMYPLALKFVRDSLAELEKDGVPYELEGFMWHQGENDMFNEEYKQNYGKNLKNFLKCWRRDLECPDLKFYLGELCTKTIWGMDLRRPMHAISVGQKSVASSDANTVYVPTAHVGVKIGGGVGLHYHYGTLGQLEHGENYAHSWLKSQGIETIPDRPLKNWPYSDSKKIQLFILAGHRNMEGERAFVQDIADNTYHQSLLRPNQQLAFKYSLGGGYRVSKGWEPLGPVGFYDTFGPELSFGATLKQKSNDAIAIAKFTHGGSQILDWTPEGSEAATRNLYRPFIKFINESIQELESHGNEVELMGVFYHVGENDMSFGPHRKNSASRLNALITQSRVDLKTPNLKWYVSQQPPTDDERVNQIDVVADFQKLDAGDPHLTLLQLFDLDGREKKLVISTPGVIQLGEKLAEAFLNRADH